VRITLRLFLVVFCAVGGLTIPVLARCEEPPIPPKKPPLTKEEERQKFHPKTRGMDAAVRLEGFRKRIEMERTSPVAGISFRGVGPEIQGGRIVDIEAPAKLPDSLFVAFASGGLWRTDNRGGSWTPLFDNESSITIGDIALADPEGKTIYVGTGENNSSRSSYSGTGIFKTTDGGKTWKNVGLADSHHIGRILVDPRDSRVVYVASMGHLYTEDGQRGVFKSTDAGATWTLLLSVPDRTGVIDLAADPSRPDVLYAATWERARTAANFLESGPGSGIWKSTDGGSSWKRLANGLPTGATAGRIGLAVAASRPDTVYAVLDNQARRPESEILDEETPPGELTPRRLRRLDAEGFARLDEGVIRRFLKRFDFPKDLKAPRLKKDVAAGKISIADLVAYLEDANRDLFENEVIGPEVYRSDDRGGTWKRTHEGRIEKVFYSYGYYFSRIAVDPADPERVYVAGVPFLGSRDGGKTWKGLDERGVHVDHHAIYIDPKAPHRLALGNDGGLNISFDYGETWTKINNLPVGQFTTLALDNAEPYNILGGLQDNGVMRGPSTYRTGKSDPAAWKSIYGGDGSCTVVDSKDANVVYTASQFGNASRLNLKTGERTRIKPRPKLSASQKEKPLRYNWVTPFILSPHSREILYYGANRVYRSFDRGEAWTAISEDLTSHPEQGDVPFGTITSLTESPKKFGVLYAGTDEGKVWGTRDGGATWSDLSRGLTKDRWVTRVVASAFDEGTVYVSQNGYRNDDLAPYLFRSADFGKTWESLTRGLPTEPINTVREDSKAKNLLYVGTDLGVFVSLDRGATWNAMNVGLPKVPVHDLLVHPKEGDLVLATHGRSIYLAEAAPLRKLTTEVRGKALHAFPVKSVQGSSRRGYGEHPYLTWSREDPVVRISYWSKDGRPVRISITDDNGNLWKELEAESRSGMNQVEYDLSADSKLADAAEKAIREKALAKEKERKEKEEKKEIIPVPAKEKAAIEDYPEEIEETEEEEEKKETGPPRPLDPDLFEALADPLRGTRKRYLPAGKYSIEVRSEGLLEKTTLVVKPEKEDRETGVPTHGQVAKAEVSRIGGNGVFKGLK